MSTPEKITGSCNCGTHKYTIPRPTQMNLCHCTDCRKWAGAMHSAHLFVKTDDIDKHDSPEPKLYTNTSDSGNPMERAWCDKCGCGIWIKAVKMRPDSTFLKAGLFNPGEIPNPTHENWLQNMEPWESPAKGTQMVAQDNNWKPVP